MAPQMADLRVQPGELDQRPGPTNDDRLPSSISNQVSSLVRSWSFLIVERRLVAASHARTGPYRQTLTNTQQRMTSFPETNSLP